MLLTSEHFTHPPRHETRWHTHDGGQVYRAIAGVMMIETERARWAVTPGVIGWIPAGVRHKAHFPGQMHGGAIYLSTGDHPPLPPEEGVFSADTFMLTLIERLFHKVSEVRQARLLAVLCDEIMAAAPCPLHLTMPQDRRARQIADALLLHPGNGLNQTQLAVKYGLSVRTLSRLFREQTGLRFSLWRQQAKVIASLSLILAGVPVSEAALESGFSNVSAYIQAFRERFGETPGKLQQSHFRR
ncbi:AraC family transcriptional regulator [Cronobacter muytjensii]|nr:AraC family transcriptional regulator [Cronobacter muytjensii]